VPRDGAGERGRRESHRGDGRNWDGRHWGHHGGNRIYIGGGWWDPWYYGYGYGWGWSGWWWPWGPGSVMYDRPYREGRGSGFGALDLDVWPGDAEIYVDGDRVGTADDFDGFPSYLWLPRGTYDVVIYLPGFQSIARQYSIYDGLVIDVNDRMERGQAVRPEDLPAKTHERRDERLRHEAEQQEAARRREEWRQRQEEHDRSSVAPGASAPGRDASDEARVHFSITPNDASVYLDGHFLGTASELEGLSAGLVVTPGSHHLEVVRPGFAAHETSFDSSPGEDVQLAVELEED
jgi:hypothetical protein